MHYEVRFLSGGEEKTILVDAETAAEAAQSAQRAQTDSQAQGSDDAFELVQVQLLDELNEISHVQPGHESSNT